MLYTWGQKLHISLPFFVPQMAILFFASGLGGVPFSLFVIKKTFLKTNIPLLPSKGIPKSRPGTNPPACSLFVFGSGPFHPVALCFRGDILLFPFFLSLNLVVVGAYLFFHRSRFSFFFPPVLNSCRVIIFVRGIPFVKRRGWVDPKFAPFSFWIAWASFDSARWGWFPPSLDSALFRCFLRHNGCLTLNPPPGNLDSDL